MIINLLDQPVPRSPRCPGSARGDRVSPHPALMIFVALLFALVAGVGVWVALARDAACVSVEASCAVLPSAPEGPGVTVLPSAAAPVFGA